MDNLEVTHPTGTGSVPPFGLFAPVDCEEERHGQKDVRKRERQRKKKTK